MPIPPLVREWMPNYYTKPNPNEKSQNQIKRTEVLGNSVRKQQLGQGPRQGQSTDSKRHKIPWAFLT
jgi:hypothetical protein